MKRENGRNRSVKSAALQESMLEWAPEQKDLWARIAVFEFDDRIVAFPFLARLARDNGWSLEFAGRVLKEYRRFAFLAVAAGHPLTPSDQVDQAWHLHLLYTRSYWDRFCRDALRMPLHHHPTEGGAEEKTKFNDWYAETLASYRRFFCDEPPDDIWPDSATRFGVDIYGQRINTRRAWVVRKGDALAVAMATLGMLLGVALLAAY